MKYLLYKLMPLEDDADANALGTNEPTIKANAGFKFEVYSIPQTVSLRSTLKSGKIKSLIIFCLTTFSLSVPSSLSAYLPATPWSSE